MPRRTPENSGSAQRGLVLRPTSVEMIQSMTGTQFTHVPFEGGDSVITALLGGHVEITCDGFAKVKPHVDAGKLRILLITNKLPAFPGIPTIAELGYKQSIPTAW